MRIPFHPLILALLLVPSLATADDSALLHDLFKREWELWLKENPLFATSVGRHEYDDRLPEITVPGMERMVKESQAFRA